MVRLLVVVNNGRYFEKQETEEAWNDRWLYATDVMLSIFAALYYSTGASGNSNIPCSRSTSR